MFVTRLWMFGNMKITVYALCVIRSKKLTSDIYNAKLIKYSKSYNKVSDKITCKNIFNKFKFNIYFQKQTTSDKNIYYINEFDNKNTLKWKLGAFNLPVNEDGKVKTFDSLAGKKRKISLSQTRC